MCVEKVPWADPESRFTYEFGELAASVAQIRDKTNGAKLLGIARRSIDSIHHPKGRPGRRGQGPSARASRPRPGSVHFVRAAAVLRLGGGTAALTSGPFPPNMLPSPEMLPRRAAAGGARGEIAMGILEVHDVSLGLGGKKVLNGLTIDFWEGHIHALVGPNGAGKSTLASAIMGLPGYTDIEGDILFEGRSLRGVPVDERARRGIALAWQEPARFEGLRVDAFVSAGAKDKSLRARRAALERVGLDPDRYLRRAVDKTLSGGERKRIELASILTMEPRVVLMDEPDSGIDVEALDRIFQALKDLKASGATVILITHSPAVLRQAEHAFLMCNGRLIDKGSVEKVSRYFEDRCISCDHENQPDPELDAPPS